MKLILSLIFTILSLYAKDISYAKNHIHAFLPHNNTLRMSIGYQTINDSLDILNIKKSQVGNQSNLDSLGNMQGLDLGLGYSFSDDFYTQITYNKKQLEYAANTLINHNIDAYIRYQIGQSHTSALAIDLGYTANRAQDTHTNDLDAINKDLSEHTDKVKITSGGTLLEYYKNNTETLSQGLSIEPYSALKNAKDNSLYLRAIFSKKGKSSLYDIFMTYKYTKLQYTIDTSIAHENLSSILPPEILETFSNAAKTKHRNENALFLGFASTQEFRNFLLEFKYTYRHMFRAKELKKENSNHVIETNLIIPFTKKIIFYIGGTFMTKQFNG